MLPLSQTIDDINKANYKLDTSGVAGLLGGDNAVDALETIHLYESRRLAGWYNYPGTVDVAKRFGQMANSRLWDSVFPGPNELPAVTFKLAGKSGPHYCGSFSGTELLTGYLGYLITHESLRSDFPCKALNFIDQNGEEGRKTGSPATVIVVSLPDRQDVRTVRDASRKHALIPIAPKSRFDPPLALFSIVPSAVSILACIFCILGHDPLCASLILLGILCSGFSSLALGTATLRIRVPVPSDASPPGDGLILEGGSAIVLKGKEADVNVVTKGEFDLDYSVGIMPHEKYHTIGFSSVLLFVQFLVQLLLTPRCTLFGQILFLISFVASGGYHLYVASFEREKVHWEQLSRVLSPHMEKWTLGTRTQMAVFVCLVLGDGNEYPHRSDPALVLKNIIPNETAVWNYWRKKVVKELERFWNPASSVAYFPNIHAEPASKDELEDDEYSQLTPRDKKLLEVLIADAWCVFNKYSEWRARDSKIWEARCEAADLKSSLLRGDSPA